MKWGADMWARPPTSHRIRAANASCSGPHRKSVSVPRGFRVMGQMGFSKAFSLLSEKQAAPQQGTWGRRGWETDSTLSIPFLSHWNQGNAEAWLSPSPPPSRASR